MLNFPDKKYGIIYIDPAWNYDENWGNGSAKHHYESMSMKELLELPISKIADKNCHLYLWYTNSFVKEAHELCEKWGFNYKITKNIWFFTMISSGTHYKIFQSLIFSW